MKKYNAFGAPVVYNSLQRLLAIYNTHIFRINNIIPFDIISNLYFITLPIIFSRLS